MRIFSSIAPIAGAVGIRSTLAICAHKAISKIVLRRFGPIAVKTDRCSVPLLMRTGHSSDLAVFKQIFIEEEYAPLSDVNEPRFIVDCGANVGYSSAWFLTAFPICRVLAIEPDPENVALCRRNLAPFGDRVSVLHAAVWPWDADLAWRRGTFGDGREWATEVAPLAEGSPGNAVRGLGIDKLVNESPVVDILKIDIEGAEVALFSRQPAPWLDRVRNIAVELHNEKGHSAFFAALENHDYVLSRSGELTICREIRGRAGSLTVRGRRKDAA